MLNLEGCGADRISDMVFIYEPETAIGAPAPLTPDQVADGCWSIRNILREHWGERAGDQVRIIYGGSVSPEHAAELLTCPDVDGLGASRKGRDPAAFAKIVGQITLVKGQ